MESGGKIHLGMNTPLVSRQSVILSGGLFFGALWVLWMVSSWRVRSYGRGEDCEQLKFQSHVVHAAVHWRSATMGVV